MTRQHCDRCNTVIDSTNAPSFATEVSSSFLTDHDVSDGVGLLRVVTKVEVYSGVLWEDVELCAECFDALMELAAQERQRA